MNRLEVFVMVGVILFYASLIGSLWWMDRQAKERIRREKMTGRLPVRRSPPAQQTINPELKVVIAVLWAFAPILGWFFVGIAVRALTPPSARAYLAPIPAFSQVLRSNLNWWLFWAGLVLLGWILQKLLDRMPGWFDDPDVVRARASMQKGDLEAGIRVLRDAIDTHGPSFARLDALADGLMQQQSWSAALEVCFDVEERRILNARNRHRKALALCKLGLPELALAGFHGTPALTLGQLCEYCQALTDLGLFSRAWDQLRRAEVRYAREVRPDDEREHFRGRIDACRTRLSEHFPEKKGDGLSEL
jgi:hypothetical protein